MLPYLCDKTCATIHPMTTFGLILAGGKSSRFQGTDKSWLEWNGLPLIEHVINRIQPQVDEILISANRDIDKYQALGFTVISDLTDELLGPLAGIRATMSYIDNQFPVTDDTNLLTAPCDMPLIPKNLKTLLSDSQFDKQVCVAKDSQRIQPLVALIPMALQKHLTHFLDSGQRKVEQWILDTNPHIIDLSKYSNSFYNVNDLSELRNLDAMHEPKNNSKELNP